MLNVLLLFDGVKQLGAAEGARVLWQAELTSRHTLLAIATLDDNMRAVHLEVAQELVSGLERMLAWHTGSHARAFSLQVLVQTRHIVLLQLAILRTRRGVIKVDRTAVRLDQALEESL